ncbi:hypothetical protein OC835_006012 [Tilletia horrida]|nr:hypothetical protein OC835_006012 [Tilletia horrida]KAK0550243.1 hypothetical protein OC844_006751 [Tilletia horrida]
MSWSSAYTITLTGPINIDTVIKKEGRFFGITAQCPSVVGYGHRGDKHSVDFNGRIWCAVRRRPTSGTLLPYATPQLHIEKCAVLCRGELPANFDAPYPIVSVLGQVLAWDAAEIVITLQTGDWDHQPFPVSADAGASDSAPNTPAKKRKYERKNMCSSGSGEGSGAIEEDEDDGPNAAPNTTADEPTTPTTTRISVVVVTSEDNFLTLLGAFAIPGTAEALERYKEPREVDKEYKKFCLRWHPDKHGKGIENIRWATAGMQLLTNCY